MSSALLVGLPPLLLLALLACHADRAERAERAEDRYTLDLLHCTKRAATRAESQACERQVDARWRVDGGAP